MQNENQFSLDMGISLTPRKEKEIFKEIRIDRKSKYTVVVGEIEKKEDIKKFVSELVKDAYFRKATHNSYAYRIKDKNGLILESKNDDGEIWAGMCILRELKRENFLWGIVIVTRYFWGIKLQTDRFKNVIEVTKEVLNILKKTQN